MSATSVGQIGLDLVVNRNQFNKQMTGIQSLAKSAGKALASAFAVKKLVDFGQECVELGSDLQEVQNVVDVTFPKMSEKVNKFAKDAAASFGLSETMAKKFTGTFGSMAKAFGFSEEQAYQMGSALTGLAGDVASFYNITQDEAYTKLKSVFTGETESLKDLGVVMTQTALDSYALANGFGKTTKNMSEAEKVALRYKFVQEQLSAAQGDFSRTSDGWANQVRVLNLQFDSLKATIGQGLINILTPVLKAINVIIGKLAVLAEGFKSFTELLTGNKSKDTAVEDSDALAKSVAGVGEEAEKSAKKMKALAGFDELNNLSNPSTDNDKKSSSGGVSVDFGSLAEGETVLDKTDNKFQSIIEKVKELAELFIQGFEISFGDSEKKIGSIFQSLQAVGKSLKDIFTDHELINSVEELFENIVTTVGKNVGAVLSVGLTIGENIIGGIADSFKSNKKFIKERLVGIFDAKKEIVKKAGELFDAFAYVFSAFSNSDAIEITSGITSIFTNAFLTIKELGEQFIADFVSFLVDPFVENAEGLKTAVEDTLEPVAKIVDTVSEGIRKSCEKVLEIYNKNIKPMFESFTEGVSDIVGALTDGYNQHIAPVLDVLAEKFEEVWEEHLQPVIDTFIELVGSLADAITELWEEIIQPFLQWCAENIMPILGPILEELGKLFGDTFEDACDIVEDLLETLKDLIEFITAVFTGDWERAWKEVKEIFSSVFGALYKIVKIPLNLIIDGLNTVIDGINAITSALPGVFQGLTGTVNTDIVNFRHKKSGIPRIPKLAQGAFVKANTPQLAIIGDNRHQGEVVAPEKKLEQMAVSAAQIASGNGSQQNNSALMQMVELLQRQNELLIAILEKEIGISGRDIFDTTREYAREYTRRTGNPAFEY